MFLEQNAVVQIKNFKKIEKLVYVSNNPEVSLKNFIEFGLLNSENYNNGSFVPEKAVVVDMLPHTKQYEMIISFKRFDKLNNTENSTQLHQTFFLHTILLVVCENNCFFF